MSGGYSMVGTALDESDDELPGSISLAQRLAPSLAEFERGRDSVTGSRRLEGAFRGGWDRQRVDTSEWKPTTFFSSRDARAKSGGESMRLEDIMDEVCIELDSRLYLRHRPEKQTHRPSPLNDRKIS